MESLKDSCSSDITSYENAPYPPKGGWFGLGCRSIRFGTFRTVPAKTLSFYLSSSGLYFYIKTNDEEEKSTSTATNFNDTAGSLTAFLARPPLHGREMDDGNALGNFDIHISWKNVERIEYSFSHLMSIVFVQVSPMASEKLRTIFKLTGDPELSTTKYFNSNSKRTWHKYITVIVNEVIDRESQRSDRMKEISGFPEVENVEFIQLNYRDANSLLTKTVASVSSTVIYEFNGRSLTKARPMPILSSRKRDLDADTAMSYLQTDDAGFRPIRHQPNQHQTLRRPVLYVPSADKSAQIRSSALSRSASPVIRIVQAPLPQSKEPDDLFAYSPVSGGQIIVHENDLRCLDEGEFLNDTIINFYLDYLVRMLPELKRQRIHLFSTYFWTKLSSSSLPSSVVASVTGASGSEKKELLRKEVHAGLRRWTKNMDLFAKDVIIIPINEDAHWYLAIICYPGLVTPVEADNTEDDIPPTEEQLMDAAMDDEQNQQSSSSSVDKAGPADQNEDEQNNGGINDPDAPPSKRPRQKGPRQHEPCIIVLDSLQEGSSRKIKTPKLIREYLAAEWASRKVKTDQPNLQFIGATIRGVYPKPPQQDNWYDCGVFLLEYAERFLFNGLIAEGNTNATGNEIGEEFWKMARTSSGKSLVDWFTLERIKTKRQELMSLMLKLSKDWKESQANDDKKNVVIDSPLKQDDIVVTQEIKKC